MIYDLDHHHNDISSWQQVDADALTMDMLPVDERIRISRMHNAFVVIAAAPYGRQGEAFALASAELGISAKTLRRPYDRWIVAGRNPMVLVDRRITKVGIKRARVTQPEFVSAWQALCLECQRSGGVPTARRRLIDRWKSRSDVIPGYEDWPGWPAIPSGWSLDNLRRLAPRQLDSILIKQGVRAAASMLPQVLATRVGLWPGSHVMFDDVWLDLLVLAGSKIGRPLQLGCLDLFTGKRLCWGQKVRVKDEETGKNRQLNEADMRLILAMWGATIGFSRRGTTLVVENGTAAINADLERILTDASGGLIKVDRSGIGGRIQALLGGYGGRGVGNPRHKAGEEVWHSLQHNRLSHLPGATGHGRSEPEILAGLIKEEKALLRAMESMPENRRCQVRHLLLTMPELCDELTKVVADINARTDHALEGWAECGHEVEEFRLSETAEWVRSDEVDPRLAESIVRMAADTGARLIRRRNMSPTEAWEAGVAQPGNGMIKLPAWAICDILGPDNARAVTIKSSYVRFRDASITRDELIYETSVTTPQGNVVNLPHGDYRAFINPYDSGKLFVCDLQGRCLGVAPIVQRVRHDDHDGIARAMGHAAQRRASQMETVRMIGAQREADIMQTREHNRRVIEGEPVTIAEHLRLADITPSPSDKAAATKRRNAATRQDMDDVMPAPVFAPVPDSSGTINLSDLY